MINWEETLRKYCDILYLARHQCVLKDLCTWYQNQCRVYEDEFPYDITEFRISKGIARWTSNFTTPTEDYKGE